MFEIWPLQVTLEEQMICGALQTLNEEAFEDVASNELGSGGSVVAPGETLSHQLQLAPIREGSEFSTSMDSGLSVAGPSFSNSFLKGSGGGNLTGMGNNHLGQPRDNTTNHMGASTSASPSYEDGSHCSSSLSISALVGLDQEQSQPQQQMGSKEATIIVMSQFTQNIDDTSL